MDVHNYSGKCRTVDIHSYRENNGTDSVFMEIKDWLPHETIAKIKGMLEGTEDWKCGDLWEKPIFRLQKWFHDDRKYFSGFWKDQTHERWKSHDHDDWLLDLRGLIQDQLNYIFSEIVPECGLIGCNLPTINSTLVNYYRNGTDIIRHHRDDEKLFGDNPTIAMLVFGAERPLDFIRSTYDHTSAYSLSKNYEEEHLNKSFTISEGSLFIMMGAVQKYYTHGIARDISITDPRYSITFREHTSK